MNGVMAPARADGYYAGASGSTTSTMSISVVGPSSELAEAQSIVRVVVLVDEISSLSDVRVSIRELTSFNTKDWELSSVVVVGYLKMSTLFKNREKVTHQFRSPTCCQSTKALSSRRIHFTRDWSSINSWGLREHGHAGSKEGEHCGRTHDNSRVGERAA
ncbi:hypothetical protein EDB84DRAFT_1513263 [Lactarius hengduanensis]|nr:hypothetical protein EDB84DRAFT_1513263 [Lactarius hengduanensis]